MGGHVFISYSHLDSGYVDRLRTYLAGAEIQAWTDQGIPKGAEWAQLIETQLRECAAFVPIMSPSARAAEWVRNEILLAMQLKKPILPLLLDGERFLELLSRQDEDVTGGRLPSREFVDQLRTLSGVATGGIIHFHGVYHAPETDGYSYYLRFYPSGEVIAVSSLGQPAEIAGWFTPGHPGISVGNYDRQPSALTFSVGSTYGVVDYRGRIDGDKLHLHSHSHINGYEDDRTFSFVAVPAPPDA